jgi:Asp-tRNA(Asn)/Glu-tRNA(Gln) amidotransferase A subunit family amidase
MIGPVEADPLGALVAGTAPADDAARPAGEGALAGARFVVKDVIDVAGLVTGAGNPDWAAAHEPAAADAAPVAALIAAGARVAGKGQCAELAFSLSGANAHFGMPRNPAAPERDPGGSTSGPAAAVAGGLCDLGLGTDTLGSVRVPASYCGIYGYRPTHGAIANDGVLPLAQRFDTVGLLARDPALLADAAGVLLTDAGLVDAQPPRRLVLAADLLAVAEEGVADSAGAAAERLAKATGAELERVDELPGGSLDLGAAMAAFNVLQGVEVWANFGEWVRTADPSLGPDIAARIQRASGFGRDDVSAAEPVGAAVAAAIARLDPEAALVIPATGTPAPARDADAAGREAARVGAGQLTCLATMSGAPAAALPLAGADGLPVGVSLVGPPGADGALLAACRATGNLGPP